jgi:hypothetical protein
MTDETGRTVIATYTRFESDGVAASGHGCESQRRKKASRGSFQVAGLEEGFETVLIHGQADAVAKLRRRELRQMKRVPQRIFETAELAAHDHLEPIEP